MSAAARKRSFDELYREIQALPEGSRGEILEPGELHVMGRPGRRHRKAAQQLYRALGAADEDSGGSGWWIELEPEVRFGERLFDPDLAGWRSDRVPELPDANPIEIVPDWACEVLSPRTTVTDVRIKLPHYLEAGVAHVWLVDPDANLIQVFAARDRQPTLVASASREEAVRLPPFELELDARRLWLGLPPDRA